VDAFLLLKLAVTGFPTAGAGLVVMSLPVEDRAADEARSKGLYGPSGALGPFRGGDLPLHYKFFHPATTSHWRRRGLLPLLTIARVTFAASLMLGLGTLIWLGTR
jgi:hypothetical protein